MILKYSCLDVERRSLSVALLTLWVSYGILCLVRFLIVVVWMGLSAPPIGGWLVDFNSYGVQVLWGLFFEQFHRTCPFPIVSVRCILIIIIII